MNIAIQLQRGESASLQDQLFEQLRQLILAGSLKPNSRVIGTRFLADQLGVSRTTVLLAYERLISEGYLETRPAVGTFVCPTPPASPKAKLRLVTPTVETCAPILPAFDLNALTPAPRGAAAETFNFDPQAADTSHLLPRKVWIRAVRDVLEGEPVGREDENATAGDLALRTIIVDRLAVTRGIMASPDQVIIVGGRRQACSLIAHLFLRRGDRVMVESPGDPQINGFFSARGATLLRTPVDELGLEIRRLPKGPVSLAYVTPARQNPVGGTLPQDRREALLLWARASGAYLIEDDIDSDLRYHGTTPPPLIATDRHGLVFYTGCFNMTLGDGFSLGYLIAPPAFVEPLLAIKSMAGDGGAWLEQAVLARLIADGDYDHHLRRLRKIYLERRDVLIDGLRSRFGEVRLIGAELGARLTWVLPDDFPKASVVSEAARARGVLVEPLFCDGGPSDGPCKFHNRALLLGYRAMAGDRLRAGVARLADAIAA